VKHRRPTLKQSCSLGFGVSVLTCVVSLSSAGAGQAGSERAKP
jgi:hypothetical protein